jgi:hypothetical protein
VHRREDEPGRDRGDAVDRGELLAWLCAGLAELREVGEDGRVRLDHVASAAAAEAAAGVGLRPALATEELTPEYET